MEALLWLEWGAVVWCVVSLQKEARVVNALVRCSDRRWMLWKRRTGEVGTGNYCGEQPGSSEQVNTESAPRRSTDTR
jgi:hypothetical protein